MSDDGWYLVISAIFGLRTNFDKWPLPCPAPSIPPRFEIAVLSGPVFLGHLLHWVLFGALNIQIYLYYQAFPNDRLFTKCLVYTVYMLELGQTIIMAHDAFAIFVYGFGDLTELMGVHWEWFVPILSGIVAFIGQSFYAYRVYVLSKSRPIPILIALISLISTVAAILTGVISSEVKDISGLQSRTNIVVSGVWFGASALIDITIAITLTHYLLRNDTGFRRTHEVVMKLIRLVIETGSLTAIIALVNLVLFVAFPAKPYFTTGGVVQPTLYANTILLILNSRMQIVGGRGHTSSTNMMSSPTFFTKTGTEDAVIR
ncbi:hypothetical protein B0H19DRAFT_1270496 [Mycena capillaripes]|nr:hypothetical protein B0H19DRAFT_1270496 [Mycena capillaripes]